MLKISTHDSATGEKPVNLLSFLMIPFARTQSKTLQEQYNAGCRYFDIRARLYKGKFHSGHGLFTTKRTLDDILEQLNNFGDTIYIQLTYEDKFIKEDIKQKFYELIERIKNEYKNIKIGPVIAKYIDDDLIIDWVEIVSPPKDFPALQSKFKALNGRTWHTFIPIPWLWKKIYFNKPEFNEDIFTQVDFL